ncbi:MAG: SCO family protein [Crocinitomicaceae bacterium]|nr:SCO family protein [Crocinitomicaceae bacterium]
MKITNNAWLIFALFIFMGYACSTEQKSDKVERVLPIAGERDVEYRMVDGVEVADTIYHHVPAFKYLNQDSVMISSVDLKEKIWITDFFFTKCPTICPPMTSQMKRLSEMTEDLSEKIQFLSFSIDPKRDTPSRLTAYIKAHDIKAKNWLFFTGEEEATHLLAKEFFNGAERNDEIAGGFGHTPYFALVDTEGLVRGIYNGTDIDQVDKLEKDLRKLLKYEYGITGSK